MYVYYEILSELKLFPKIKHSALLVLQRNTENITLLETERTYYNSTRVQTQQICEEYIHS